MTSDTLSLDSALRKTVEDFYRGISEIREAIFQKTDGVYREIVGREKVNETIQNIYNQITRVMNNFISNIGNINLGDALENIRKNIEGKIKSSYELMKQELQNGIKELQGKIREMSKELTDFRKTLASKIGEFAEDISNGIVSLGDKLKTGMQDFAMVVKESLTQTFTNFEKAMAGGIQSVRQGIDNIINNVNEKISSIKDAIKTSLDSMWKNLEPYLTPVAYIPVVLNDIYKAIEKMITFDPALVMDVFEKMEKVYSEYMKKKLEEMMK